MERAETTQWLKEQWQKGPTQWSTKHRQHNDQKNNDKKDQQWSTKHRQHNNQKNNDKKDQQWSTKHYIQN